LTTERNRWNLPREYQWNREQLQRQERDQDRIAAAREDEEIYRANEDRRQKRPFFNDLARFALMGSMAALAARKGMTTDVGRRVMGNLGSMIDQTGRVLSHASGVTAGEALRATGFQKGAVSNLLKTGIDEVPQYRHLEIAEAMEDVLRVQESLRPSTGAPSSSPFYQDLVDAARDRVTARFSAGSRSIKQVQELTVGNIMDMSEGLRGELFGSNKIEALQWGLERNIISKKSIAGGGLYWDSAKSKVLHVHTAGQIGQAVKGVANQINIPFTGIRMGDILAPPIEHVFGKGRFGGVVRDPSGGRGRGAVLGGEFYKESVSGGQIRLEHAGSGYNIGDAGIMGEASMARRGMLGIQKGSEYSKLLDDPKYVREHPFRSLAMSVSELVGIGPQYRSEDQVFARLYQAGKRHMRGNPLVVDTHSRGDGGFQDKLLQQISKNLDVDPETGLKKSFQESIDQYGSRQGTGAKYKDISFFDKIKAVFGVEDKVIYTDPGAKNLLGDPVVKRIVSKPPAGTSSKDYGSRRHIGNELPTKDLSGNVSTEVPLNQYAYGNSLYSKVADTAHYMTNRLNQLVGFTAGVGSRPTPGGMLGAVGNLAKIYGMYTGLKVGMESIRYADYMASINGYAPSDLLLDTFATGRNFLQQVREQSGASPAARYLEDLMPGSVDSTFFSTLRTVGPTALGVYKKSPLGIAAGLALGAVMGPGLTQTPEETRDILSGDQLVPVRSGRYWAMGKQPYEGGRIEYYAPGLVARQRSNYQYTDTLYGSKAEYFQRHSSLPTPSNLFGLLSDQNALIEKHAADRPYPVNPDANYASFGGGAKDNQRVQYGAYGPPTGAGASLGFSPLQAKMPHRESASGQGLANRLGQMSELSGIYKFAMWTMPGLDSRFEQGSQPYADPAFMASSERAFYDEGLGGMMGMSELYRRFVTSDQYRTQRGAYNPIPNTMPSWLPGAGSQFTGRDGSDGDLGYHIDFTRGDPYSKIKHGEFRLPGAAYERMHRLHSGAPGVYDAVDQFLILSDVAPHSDAFKHYRTIVSSWQKSGVIDQNWIGKIESAKEQVSQKMERYQFSYRRFWGTSGPKPKDGQELPEYNVFERAVGGAWEAVTHGVVPRIGVAVPVLGPMLANKFLAERDPIEQYLKNEVYDTSEYSWEKPYTTMLRPMAEQLKATDPLTATAGGGLSGFVFGANPIAKAVFAAAGAMYFGGSSTTRMIKTGQATGGYVPDYVTERREMQEYFDNLEYAKFRKLETQAASMGRNDLAKYFSSMKNRTVASLDYSAPSQQFNASALKALPSRERAFFQHFLDSPEDQRQNILQYIPEYIKPVYQAAWSKQGDNRFSYKDFQRGADERVAQYFSSHGLPPDDWVGWNPDVNMDHVRVKTVDSMGNSAAQDLHRMNIWEGTADTARIQYPGTQLDVSEHFRGRDGFRQDIMQMLRSELVLNGMDGVTIENDLAGGLENVVNWNVGEDRMSSVFALAEDILRS